MRRIAIRALIIHAMRSRIAAHGQTVVVPAPIRVVPVAISANRAGTACTNPNPTHCPTACWTCLLRISCQLIPTWPVSDSELDGSRFRISRC
jgi:hypothetical protein